MDRTITLHKQNHGHGRRTGNKDLVRILAVLPLAAVATSWINGFALGFTVLLTLVVSSACVCLLRRWLRADARIPATMIVSASLVAAVELTLNAYFHEICW
jgi:electron transport complex protein RnfE